MNENLYPKSFSEKLGDFLTKKENSALILIIGFFFLFPLGFIMALSIRRGAKTFFKTNFAVRLNSGEMVPCAIIEEKHYLFFDYLPFKSDYYLVKNMCSQSIAPGTRVQNSIIQTNLIETPELTKAKVIAVQQNPQILLPEIETQFNSRAREDFLSKIQEFFTNDILKEVYYTNTFSVCQYENYYAVFFYNFRLRAPIGIILKNEFVENSVIGKQYASAVLDVFLNRTVDALLNTAILFDRTFLEKKLTPKSRENNAVAKETLDKINAQKILLTRQEIEVALYRGIRSIRGVLSCICAGFFLAIGIAFCCSSAFIIGVPMVLLALWCGYKGVKKTLGQKQTKLKISNGQYKITKTTCTDISFISGDSDSGDSYLFKFATGDKKEFLVDNFCRVGDPVYIVHIEGEKEASAFFNAVKYYPEQGLVVEDTINY